MGGVGIVFFGVMFVISCRILVYFRSVELMGDLLARHLLAMIILTFFSLLIFSHIITAISNLYLSRDLEFCHSLPVSIEELFISRAIHTVIDSSWMFIIFGLPIFMAYAYVYQPGLGFFISLIHMNVAMVIMTGGIGIFITMVLVHVFPAQRTRDIIMLLILFMVIALYIFFRLLRPERLVDPEAFFTVMQYLNSLRAPQSPYLPTQWILETLWGGLRGTSGTNHFLEIMLTWSTAAAVVVINIWVAQAVYFQGYSKSQEAKNRRRAGKWLLEPFARILQRLFRQDVGAVIGKDIRTFFRDNTQWSQLLLLGALVIVYVYNFKVLPLDKSPIRIDFLQNTLAFLNMGLAGFVLAAVSARFVFTAVSAEGEAFWIIRSSPIGLRRYILGKYLSFLLPMLILGEILVIITNYLLEVSHFMMALSSVTMFFMVFGIVALGIGYGAMYPNFKFQNIAQVSTGFGGMMFMILSSLYIAGVIVLEAGPVYILFMSDVRGNPITSAQWFFIFVSFTSAFVINVFTTIKPLKMGLKALNTF